MEIVLYVFYAIPVAILAFAIYFVYLLLTSKVTISAATAELLGLQDIGFTPINDVHSGHYPVVQPINYTTQQQEPENERIGRLLRTSQDLVEQIVNSPSWRQPEDLLRSTETPPHEETDEELLKRILRRHPDLAE